MKTSDLNKSAKKVHKALLEPISVLTKILRKKLRGAYGTCHMRGWKHMHDIHRVYLNNEFPGCCYIGSKNKQRYLVITIKFNWEKWDMTIQSQHHKNELEFDVNDERKNPKNHFDRIKFEKLNNPNFIKDVKKWLNDEDIEWKKWEEK